MGIINIGNQVIDYSFQEGATSANFNRVFRDTVKPGIYTGGVITQQTANSISISPLKAVIRSSDVAADKAISFRTNTSIVLSLPATPSADYTIYIIFSYAATITNYADFSYRLTSGSPAANEIILGRVVNDGAGAISIISYSNRTRGTFDVDNTDALTADVNPTQDWHVGNKGYNDLRYQLVDSEYIRGRNATGSPISAFRCVRAIGDYASSIAAIGAITDIANQNPIGFTTQSVANSTTEYLLRRGRVSVTGLDSTGSVLGNAVYVDSTGTLTLSQTAKQVGYVLALSNPAVILLDIGGSGGSGGTGATNYIVENVNQSLHGFAEGNSIYLSTTGWHKAQANDGATVGNGIVSRVVDSNNFEVTLYGEVTLTTGQWDAVTGGTGGLTTGATYYTDATTAGHLTTSILAIENPIFQALSSTLGFVSPGFVAAESGAGNTLIFNTFTGDGATTSFTLSGSPVSNVYCFAFVGGVLQSDFTINGNQIVFTTAPALNARIEVKSIIATVFSNEISQYVQRTSFSLTNGSSIIFNSAGTIFTNVSTGQYQIWDQSDATIYASFAFTSGTPPTILVREMGNFVSASDIAGNLCLILSGNDLSFKNNLGSTKTFVIHRLI